MKITALEIKQHEFEKSFRGYNIEEVDIFLNNLASEWERTSNESKMLRMQLEIAEKEAAKLREVEMSLIKTLQSAESTSNKITEHAKIEAERKLEEAQLSSSNIIENAKKEAEMILANAKSESETILSSANSQSESILSNAKTAVSESQQALINQESSLKTEITALESYKQEVVNQLQAISSLTSQKIEGMALAQPVASPKIEAKLPEVIEENTPLAETPQETSKEEEIKAEEPEDIQGFASSANNLVLEKNEPTTESPESNEDTTQLEDDLTVIEGIGPKIAEVLNANDIKSYRDLATKPAYQVKEILGYAGSNFAMHDPSTWAEQAMLADSGKWDQLEALKEELIGGKKEAPKAVEPKPDFEATPTPEQATEEMLDRVNKVKAALKKAMIEKEGTSIIETTPKVKTINDMAADKSSEEGSGSFFDSLG
ncbi:DivIVA domain-containing protein [uncultured Arcticibacterium sp.]|uniref:DivIVA domain-containing protein n=1 Tax=uncultured Arcticibacterium sp. TaxID=2173042 RepID=UPI0030FAD496